MRLRLIRKLLRWPGYRRVLRWPGYRRVLRWLGYRRVLRWPGVLIAGEICLYIITSKIMHFIG